MLGVRSKFLVIDVALFDYILERLRLISTAVEIVTWRTVNSPHREGPAQKGSTFLIYTTI